jgi:hypothetical protein
MDFHAQLTDAINRIRTQYGHLDAHQFASHLVEEIKSWALKAEEKVDEAIFVHEPEKPVDGKDLPEITGTLNLTQLANSLL